MPLPALAHAGLASSEPADGDVMSSAPTEVVFTFTEPVAGPAFVTVLGPDGSNVAEGDAVIDGATVTQSTKLLPQQGAYTASYRVISADGHPVVGTIHFTVDPLHANAAPAEAACADDCRGATTTPLWQRESTWIVAALAALAAGIALVFGLGLRSRPSGPDPGGDT
jgi:methionine-rich copper-binding protein CopC